MSAPPELGLPPLVAADLPGAGGVLEARPEDFVVEELELYPPAGEGEHLFLRLRREGWTSEALTRALARRLALDPRDVGLAGRKDKHARATQSVSLPWPRARDPEEARAAARALGLEVLGLARHGNKLRRGQHAGNRFAIRVRRALPDGLERARTIAAALRDRGWASFHGPQRYGADGANAERGLELLRRGRRPREPLARLCLSAWQSALFDRWLALRLERGLFQCLLPGDLAQRVVLGRVHRATFLVEDAERETARMRAGEITFSGPMPGARAPLAAGEAGRLEAELFADAGVSERQLARVGLPGARRTARLPLPELVLEREGEDLLVCFALPAGAYATTLLDELCRLEGRPGAPPDSPPRGPYTRAPAWLRPRLDATGARTPAPAEREARP
jgi:tRNA pseudouridine13 synthase